MLFQLVQIVYWIALSTWFGGVLFIAVAAQVVLRTVAENKPILPHVLSVNLEGQHGTLLGGTIVAQLIAALSRIELICAAVLLLALGAQWFVIDVGTQWNRDCAIVRSALFVIAKVIVIYDSWVLSPKIWRLREAFIENADDPDKANPALEEFNRYQQQNVNLLFTLTFVLLGIVLFSGAITPPQSLTFVIGN
jgi:hypothetical protein